MLIGWCIDLTALPGTQEASIKVAWESQGTQVPLRCIAVTTCRSRALDYSMFLHVKCSC